MKFLIKRLSVTLGLLALVSCGAEPSDTPIKQQGDAPSSLEITKPIAPKTLLNARSFESSLIPQPVKYHIYLPPSYDASTSRTYPVVYWLHGSGGFPPGALNMLAGRFHKAIGTKKTAEVIVVFPDGFGQSMWLNSKDGQLPMEDIFIEALIPHIDGQYRTVKSRNGRMLEGGSMGGYGAARFGFKYPEMFTAISMLNPGPMQQILDINNAPIVGREGAQNVIDRVYGGDMDYFRAQSPWHLAELNTEDIKSQLKIRLLLGERDEITINNIAFSERLKGLNIEHQLVILANAGHNPREMFGALGDNYWSFFDRAFDVQTEDNQE